MKIKNVTIEYLEGNYSNVSFEFAGSDVKASWKKRTIYIYLVKGKPTKFSAGGTEKEHNEISERLRSFAKYDQKMRKMNDEIKEREQEIIELLKKEKHARVKLLVHGFLK